MVWEYCKTIFSQGWWLSVWGVQWVGDERGKNRIPHSVSLQSFALLCLSMSGWIDFCIFQSKCAKQVSRAKGPLSYDTEYANWYHINCGGSPPSGPPPATDENKSTKTRSAWGGKVADLSKEKGQETVPQWAFIGFICIGIQGVYVKLINHCQAVMIEQ